MLSNIMKGGIGKNLLDLGRASVKSVTAPWNKGLYVEAGPRAVSELGTL